MQPVRVYGERTMIEEYVDWRLRSGLCEQRVGLEVMRLYAELERFGERVAYTDN